MSWEFCEVTEQKARKDYRCEACDYIRELIGEGVFTFSDMRKIVEVKRKGWKILKGERYMKCQGKWDGEFEVFRAVPEMNDLCHKYDLYVE